MATKYESNEDGYTAFEVQVSVSQDFQSVATRLRYEFGVPQEADDVVEPHGEASALAENMAKAKLAEVLNQKESEVKEARAKQGKRKPKTQPKEEPKDPDDVVFQQVTKRGGRGTIRFRPTENLSPEALKAMVAEAIKDKGADPSLHVIYDERTGPNGIENGGKGYGFVSIKPTEDNPAYSGMLNNKGYPKASFYADFEDDGTVRVTPSGAYKDAARGAQEEDDDLPF